MRAPLELMPSYMQFISRGLPLTYFSDGLQTGDDLQKCRT
jgi:hypothetical protein